MTHSFLMLKCKFSYNLQRVMSNGNACDDNNVVSVSTVRKLLE